jgi:hypothetical protein
MEIEEISIKFEQYEKEIIEAIKQHLPYSWITESVQLVYWVCMLPINNEISKNITLGTSLPMVAAVWENSWRLYFFSLKVLLPKLFEEIWKKWK